MNLHMVDQFEYKKLDGLPEINQKKKKERYIYHTVAELRTLITILANKDDMRNSVPAEFMRECWFAKNKNRSFRSAREILADESEAIGSRRRARIS